MGTGLLISAAFFAFTTIFAGAAAGNAGAVSDFREIFIPFLVLSFLAYFSTSIVLFKKGHWQLAQYTAWSPVLLFFALQSLQLVALLF